MEIITFKPDMQQSVDDFFSKCFSVVGIPYSPMDRHADIANIEQYYMKKDGCFWCLLDNQTLVGTVAFRTYYCKPPSRKIFQNVLCLHCNIK